MKTLELHYPIIISPLDAKWHTGHQQVSSIPVGT